MKILFLGDIQGKAGRKVVTEYVPNLRGKYGLDAVVINGENMAGRGGITVDTLKEMYSAGVDAVTLGNHMFKHPDGLDGLLERDRKIVIPSNFTSDIPGEGFRVIRIGGKRLGVLSLYGNVWMPNKAHCPFKTSRDFFKKYRLGEDYDALVVDIHAETSSEKQCLGYLWDGKASLVVGTHTHTPTSDTRIQPKGTAYQTDAGMCGDYHSSLGCTYESALPLMESSRPNRLQVAVGPATLCGVYVEVSDETGLAVDVQQVQYGGVLPQKEIVT